jgi:hypothetical protein
MKKQYIVWAVVIIVIIIGGVWIAENRSGSSDMGAMSSSTASVSPTQTTKLSSSLSQFKNEELGFSVQYPSAWEADSADAGVTFVIPDQFPQTTLGTLQASIQVLSGTCAFPPVVTVKDKGTMNVGDLSFDTLSIENSVQGRDYFDHLYALQKGGVCYMFIFNSVTVNPTTKGFSTSDVPKIDANNQLHISDADDAFKAVVSSFTFVSTPAGQDEATVKPVATSTGK